MTSRSDQVNVCDAGGLPPFAALERFASNRHTPLMSRIIGTGGLNRTIGRVRLFFLGLFTVSAILIGYYQLAYAQPAKRCEASGRVWDNKTRACATLVFLPDLTGRPAPPGVERPPGALRFR